MLNWDIIWVELIGVVDVWMWILKERKILNVMFKFLFWIFGWMVVLFIKIENSEYVVGI